jgi:hypothetical protein
MGMKFYSETGEGQELSPKLQKISKESLDGRRKVFIPELRITVYTKINETLDQTRERYLNKTITYGPKKSELGMIK